VTLLQETRRLFEHRDAQIGDYIRDDRGRFAFRCRFAGDRLVVAALSHKHTNGDLSVRVEVPRTARDENRLVVIRVRERFVLFDPDTLLDNGTVDRAIGDKRADRGEKWVFVDPAVGISYEAYVDGRATLED